METDDYLPLSGLQHLAFCERQCALIHVEGVWAENRLTVEGRQLHERVDEVADELRDGVKISRGLPLRSDRLKLVGKADVVEFRSDGPYPIEYKRGARKAWRHDELQLCAQAMCLEEMLDVEIRRGSLFYGASRRRREVAFDGALRARTEEAASRFHEMVRRKLTPLAVLMPKCRNCSLQETCMPSVSNGSRSASKYVADLSRVDGLQG